MRVAIARYIRNRDNYFFDLFDATSAGTLRAAGHDVGVIERILAPGFDEGEVLDGMIAFLREYGPALVFLSYLPSVDLPSKVKEATGSRIAAFGSRLMLEVPGLDFVLAEPDPLSCLELVEALEGTRDFSSVGALTWKDGEGIHSSGAPLHPMLEIFTRGAVDYTSFLRLGPGRNRELRKHIAGDWGCAYRNFQPGAGACLSKAALERGAQRYPCPDFVPKGGCTFCTRPATHPLPWDLKREILAVQLDKVLEAFPNLSKLILIDENALSFVDQFAQFLLTRPMDNVQILVSGRLDHVSRHAERLEKALETLAGRNVLRLYQFGIENLSDRVLERYNKGLTFSDIAETLAQIKELCSRHVNLGVEPSFGFILFDPWTTPGELRENVERAPLVDLDYFRANAPFTSLRLYPEAPLYWKARAEGLLTGTVNDNDFGYAVNSGWRFKYPETESIYHALINRQGEAEPWKLLQDILDNT